MARSTCGFDGCERRLRSRGLCEYRLYRQDRGLPLDAPPLRRHGVDFEELVAKADGCWEWLGYVDQHTGYGRLSAAWAHRVSYERRVGPIPSGYQIDHLCRNRRCVNPAHLEAVPQVVNIARGNSPSAIAARTNRCKRGHEFTPENTYHRPDSGYRQCRECIRLRRRRYWHAEKEAVL